jgi:hypothetical protein
MGMSARHSTAVLFEPIGRMSKPEKVLPEPLFCPYGCGLLWITPGVSIAPDAAKAEPETMSNVIPLAPRLKKGRPSAIEAEERAALAADLIDLIERVREVTEQVAAFPGPALQVQQTAQHLLDSGTALERAVESLTEGGEWVPF